MNNYYNYVAPDYKFRFGISGDWFLFEDESFSIRGELEDGNWKLDIFSSDPGPSYIRTYYHNRDLDSIPYETLVSFRKALGIRGLEWVLDKEVTLLK